MAGIPKALQREMDRERKNAKPAAKPKPVRPAKPATLKQVKAKQVKKAKATIKDKKAAKPVDQPVELNVVSPAKRRNLRSDSSDSMGGLKLDEGYYGSPRWTYEILDCAMPMTFDTYSNCAHQCLYCFSFFQRAIGDGAEDYLHHKVRPVNVDRVKRMFTNPDEYGSQFKNYIKRRMVLQWGGLSDGFDWYEKKFGISLDLLKFWNEMDYPISISTKGVWFVDDPRYIEQLQGKKNQHWKYSIITSNEDHVKKLEPGTPPARKRFEAMYKLNKLGVGATTLRFRPFVLGTSDLCIDEMMQMAADAGCISVTTEFLTWESRASTTSRSRLDAMSKTLGYDIWQFYLENSARASGLLRLNYDLKRPYILKMKEVAEKHGLKFFVSDAHHKEDSYHAGCCGLPETGPLSNVNRGQYAHAILLAKKNGYVKWSDIKDEAHELLKDIPLYGAEGFPTDSVERAKRRYQNMYDYMHDIWNNPKSWQSPNRYFGGALVASAPDKNGDIIYLYNKPFIEEGLAIGSVNELAKSLRLVGKGSADRFDEMTKDGTEFAHIAYPIYVVSRRRWATATTIKLLDAARLNYSLLVPKSELEYYSEKYPHADISVIDDNASGAGVAKYEVATICKEQGYPYVWILDDDIKEVIDRDENPVSLRIVLSTLERWIEDFSNVSMLGLSLKEGDTPDTQLPPFDVNAAVRGFMLVNLQTGETFNPSLKVYEDIELALRHITKGWVTIQYNQFKARYSELPGGGASSYYINNPDAKFVKENYPEAVTLDMETAGVDTLEVEWQTYPASLRSRHVDLLIAETFKGE